LDLRLHRKAISFGNLKSLFLLCKKRTSKNEIIKTTSFAQGVLKYKNCKIEDGKKFLFLSQLIAN